MRRALALIIITCLSTLINCKSDDPGIDCSASDLSLEVSEFVKSDCDDPGSVSLTASGGEGEYTYSIGGGGFQSSPVFEGLFAGNFTFSVKDELGCIESIQFTLDSEPTGITLNLTGTQSNCTSSTGTITAEASGGVGSLQFAFNGGGFSDTNEFNNIGAGGYSVTVRDEEGCRVTKNIQILTETSLATDIMPIINKDCAISGCHNGSQSPRLISTSEVIANAARIKSETQAGSMPRDRTLTQTEIDLIACWVDDGALDN
ncbi:hypothetical protein [Ekhidna sp. To15]|uniref:hypothetical protein n=1 Tax=Ekhidna sp. To15 TaxID=3395267 RepID=UPI003F51D29B